MHARGKEQFAIHFDVDEVFARRGEGQVGHLVDQVDPLMGAFGFEFPLNERLEFSRLETHLDLHLVVTSGDIAHGDEPDHEGVNEREFPGARACENTQEGLFARAGVDMDPIAGDPSEELRFGLHVRGGERGRTSPFGASGECRRICLAGIFLTLFNAGDGFCAYLQRVTCGLSAMAGD